MSCCYVIWQPYLARPRPWLVLEESVMSASEHTPHVSVGSSHLHLPGVFTPLEVLFLCCPQKTKTKTKKKTCTVYVKLCVPQAGIPPGFAMDWLHTCKHPPTHQTNGNSIINEVWIAKYFIKWVAGLQSFIDLQGILEVLT